MKNNTVHRDQRTRSTLFNVHSLHWMSTRTSRFFNKNAESVMRYSENNNFQSENGFKYDEEFIYKIYRFDSFLTQEFRTTPICPVSTA